MGYKHRGEGDPGDAIFYARVDPEIFWDDAHEGKPSRVTDELTVPQAICVLATAAGGDAKQFASLVGLAGGLTLDEVAKVEGVTRQAIHKRIKSLPGVVQDILGARLCSSPPLVAAFRAIPAMSREPSANPRRWKRPPAHGTTKAKGNA